MDPGQAHGAFGEPAFVKEKEPHHLAEGKGGNSEIIPGESQGRYGQQHPDQAGGHHRASHAHQYRHTGKAQERRGIGPDPEKSHMAEFIESRVSEFQIEGDGKNREDETEDEDMQKIVHRLSNPSRDTENSRRGRG